MIEVKDLSAGYHKADILHGICLTAAPGEITVVIGRNGCGKSTLLKAVCGLLPVRCGELAICGTPAASLSPAERAKLTAYLPQTKNTPDITVGRMVLHGRFPYLSYPRKYKKEDYAIADAAMAKMDISHLADRLLAELSGGTRQKVYIAMALAQCAPVIVMDEPTSGLDIGQQLRFADIARTLAGEGKTVLLVLHDLPLALKLSDRICVMNDGRTALCGTPEEILQSRIIPELYGTNVLALHTPQSTQYYYQM